MITFPLSRYPVKCDHQVASVIQLRATCTYFSHINSSKIPECVRKVVKHFAHSLLFLKRKLLLFPKCFPSVL